MNNPADIYQGMRLGGYSSTPGGDTQVQNGGGMDLKGYLSGAALDPGRRLGEKGQALRRNLWSIGGHF